MSKIKTTFYCQNCGSSHSKWQGQCSTCKEWNTLSEEIIQKTEKKSWSTSNSSLSKAVKLTEVNPLSEERIITPNKELNRVLGGGIVYGSVTLLGGEPGIGKSTLLLQIALSLKHPILYVSGEESANQIKLRAERLNLKSDNCLILTETKTDVIFNQIKKVNPTLVIIDSIQTLQSPIIDSTAGSVSQIRECANEFIKFAKETNTPVLLIGHITKDGQIAGPKILEHMVDTVLQFEGDRNHIFRIIRALKNRFGSTNELAIYEMDSFGLKEINNPSKLLLSSSTEELSGNAIAVTIEGIRPLLVEIQALVSSAVYGTPQRTTTGFNVKRLNMLLAVLEKRAGFKLSIKDVFLNLTGGISIQDPALDLAVAMAILSSNADIPIPKSVCFAAEVGLNGELRPVNKVEQRIIEAERLGFKTIYVSEFNSFDSEKYNIKIKFLTKIEDVVYQLFS